MDTGRYPDSEEGPLQHEKTSEVMDIVPIKVTECALVVVASFECGWMVEVERKLETLKDLAIAVRRNLQQSVPETMKVREEGI